MRRPVSPSADSLGPRARGLAVLGTALVVLGVVLTVALRPSRRPTRSVGRPCGRDRRPPSGHAPGRSCLRDQHREQELPRHLGSATRRAVPVPDAPGEGRAADAATTAPPTTAWATTSPRSPVRAPTTRSSTTAGRYTAFRGTGRTVAPQQIVGNGCVYPASVKTIADQLGAVGLGWRGYLQDMATPCQHPSARARSTRGTSPSRASSTPPGTTRSSTSARSPATRPPARRTSSRSRP